MLVEILKVLDGQGLGLNSCVCNTLTQRNKLFSYLYLKSFFMTRGQVRNNTKFPRIFPLHYRRFSVSKESEKL